MSVLLTCETHLWIPVTACRVAEQASISIPVSHTIRILLEICRIIGDRGPQGLAVYHSPCSVTKAGPGSEVSPACSFCHVKLFLT